MSTQLLLLLGSTWYWQLPWNLWVREVDWANLVIVAKHQEVEAASSTLSANAAGLNRSPSEHNKQVNFQTVCDAGLKM